MAYNNKPRDGLAGDKGGSATTDVGNIKPAKAIDSLPQTSSVEEIKNALSSSKLPSIQVYGQANNINTQKALSAYNQTSNQVLKTQIRQSVSGIDTYA